MNARVRTALGLSFALGMLAPAAATPTPVGAGGGIVVANRGGASISVIEASSGRVTTIALPPGEARPEPMYVVHAPRAGRVFVGDRANSRVVVFETPSFRAAGMIPVGAGVFHMWGDSTRDQLWVVNDIDKTITVIDMTTLRVITTFPTPDDLNASGGKPHDVVLDPTGEFGYVSMVGVSGPNDYVVKYSASTFIEVDREAVGKDPHLGITGASGKLFVPTQGADEVAALSRATLDTLTRTPAPNAHGAAMSRDASVFFTTNIADAGAGGLMAISADTADVLWTLDLPHAMPHNLALSPDGRQLYVTHSGAASDRVTIVDVESPRNPTVVRSIGVGLNPFGIATLAPAPCAADFNHDGTLDSQDLFDFLGAFFGGCP